MLMSTLPSGLPQTGSLRATGGAAAGAPATAAPPLPIPSNILRATDGDLFSSSSWPFSSPSSSTFVSTCRLGFPHAEVAGAAPPSALAKASPPSHESSNAIKPSGQSTCPNPCVNDEPNPSSASLSAMRGAPSAHAEGFTGASRCELPPASQPKGARMSMGLSPEAASIETPLGRMKNTSSVSFESSVTW